MVLLICILSLALVASLLLSLNLYMNMKEAQELYEGVYTRRRCRFKKKKIHKQFKLNPYLS